MKNEIDMSVAIRLREAASGIGRGLVWHCNNSPLEAWQAAAAAGCKLDCWPGNLFHALYNARPKREPTALELGEIALRLEAMRGGNTVPLETIMQNAADPDWALFSLPEADII